ATRTDMQHRTSRGGVGITSCVTSRVAPRRGNMPSSRGLGNDPGRIPRRRKPMRKLQIDEAGVIRIALQQEIGRSEESRYDHRLHGLLLLAAGHSCQDVAALFGEDDTTVQRWLHRFEEGGLDALRESERPGRPRSLD